MKKQVDKTYKKAINLADKKVINEKHEPKQ